MITYIKINGFKSFQDFEMEFAPLTIIAGVNASGKSNLFDAIKLLSDLAEKDLKTAFREQRGNPSELFTQFGDEWFADEMDFEIDMLVDPKIKDNWGGIGELKYTRLKYRLKIKRIINERGLEDLVVAHEHLENLKHDTDEWVKDQIPKPNLNFWRPKVEAGRRDAPFIHTEDVNGIPRIIVPQDGAPGGNEKSFPAQFAAQTVLSSINAVDFPHVFAVKEEMRSWRFLQLNPKDLREPTRQDVGMRDAISSSGENLAAALYRIYQSDPYNLTEISRKLNSFLPDLTEVNVYDDKANRQFIIKIKAEDGREFSSRVLSEGTLQLLTLCVFQYDDQYKGLICFEEPENGIHPSRIKPMIRLLKDLTVNFSDPNSLLRQIIVNTHSPVLVSELIQWTTDNNVRIWFSRSFTLIKEAGEKRIKLKATKMLPVANKNGSHTAIHFSAFEQQLTIAEVKKYLESSDTENALTPFQ